MKKGNTVATRRVANKIAENKTFALQVTLAMQIYKKGNWGKISDADKEMNDQNAKSGSGSLMGAYMTCEGKIWIMTEHDRSVTTILFPDEY